MQLLTWCSLQNHNTFISLQTYNYFEKQNSVCQIVFHKTNAPKPRQDYLISKCIQTSIYITMPFQTVPSLTAMWVSQSSGYSNCTRTVTSWNTLRNISLQYRNTQMLFSWMRSWYLKAIHANALNTKENTVHQYKTTSAQFQGMAFHMQIKPCCVL